MVAEEHPTFHGLMPPHNPILGTFKHAPCAKNAGSKYFREDITSFNEYMRLKALRHNPFTGQFHSGPKQFSGLHGLHRFRKTGLEAIDIAAAVGVEQKYCTNEEDGLVLLSPVSLRDGFGALHGNDNDYSSLPGLADDVAEFGIGKSMSRGSFDSNGSGSASSSACSSSSSTTSSSGDGMTAPFVPEKVKRFQSISYSQSAGALAPDTSTSSWWEVRDCRGRQSSLAHRDSVDYRPKHEAKKRNYSFDDLYHFDTIGKSVSFKNTQHHRSKPRAMSEFHARGVPNAVGMAIPPTSGNKSLSPRARRISDSLSDAVLCSASAPTNRSYLMERLEKEEEGTITSSSSISTTTTTTTIAIEEEDQPIEQISVIASPSNGRQRHQIPERRRRMSSREDVGMNDLLPFDGFVDFEANKSVDDHHVDFCSRWIIQNNVMVTSKYKLDMTPSGDLGKGAYSIAKIATHRKNGKCVAIKIVRKKMLVSREEKDMIKREVEIHQVLNHHNIIALHEIFEDSKRLFLVMEKANGGTLEQYITQNGGRLSEAQGQYVSKGIIQAVSYLHDNGVLQGDIKPSNVLLTCKRKAAMSPSSIMDFDIKLCDFGLSRKVPDVKYYKYTGDVHKIPYTTLCGTMGYVAPEILKKEPYTIAADMWSVGIMTYEMLGGIEPFVPYHDCLTVPLFFPHTIFKSVSPAAIELVQKMIVVDVSNRITAKQALKHIWVETSEIHDTRN